MNAVIFNIQYSIDKVCYAQKCCLLYFEWVKTIHNLVRVSIFLEVFHYDTLYRIGKGFGFA